MNSPLDGSTAVRQVRLPFAIRERSGDASAVPRAPKGIDPAPVTAWLAAEVGVVPPLDFDPIAGGASNLTFVVTDAGGRRVVLRRPPTGHVLASAHDMGREHRVISALAPTPVPVPPALGLCTDPAVNGADFYVMDHVDGSVVFDRDDAVGRSTGGAASHGPARSSTPSPTCTR